MRKFFSKYNIYLIVLLTIFLFPFMAKTGTFMAFQLKPVFENENILINMDISDSINIKKIVFYQAEQAMTGWQYPDTGEQKVFFPLLPGVNMIEIEIQYKDGSVKWEVISPGKKLYQDYYKKYNIPDNMKDIIFPLVHFLNINPSMSGRNKGRHIRSFLGHFKKKKYKNLYRGINEESVLEGLFKDNPGFYLKWLVRREAALDKKTRKILMENHKAILDNHSAKEKFFAAFIRLIHRRMSLGIKIRQLAEEENHALITEEIETLNVQGAQVLLTSMAKLFYEDKIQVDPTAFFYNNGYYFLKKAILMGQNDRDGRVIDQMLDLLNALVRDIENKEELKEKVKKSKKKGKGAANEPFIYSYTYNIILADLVKILPTLQRKTQMKLAELVVHMALSKQIDNYSIAGDVYHTYLYPLKKESPDWFYGWLEKKGDERLAERDYPGAWQYYKTIYKHSKESNRGEIFFINTFQSLFMLGECREFARLYTDYASRLSPEYQKIFRGIKEDCKDDEAVTRYLKEHLAIDLESVGSKDRYFNRQLYLMHLVNSTYRPLEPPGTLRKRRTYAYPDNKVLDDILNDYITSPAKCRLMIQTGPYSNRFKEEILTKMKDKLELTGKSPLVYIRITQRSATGYIEIRLDDQLNKKTYFTQLPPSVGIESQIDETIGILAYWLEDIKNDTTLSFGKAAIFASQENWEKALTELKKLYQYFCDSKLIKEQLVEVYQQLSLQHADTEPEKAVRCTRESIKLLETGEGQDTKNEKLKDLKLRLAVLYRNSGQYQKSIRIFRELYGQFPGDRSVMQKYMFSAAVTDKKLAGDLLSGFLRAFGTGSLSPTEDADIAFVYSKLKNCREARKYGERAFINNINKDCQINHIYGTVLMDCGSIIETLEVLKKGLDYNANYHAIYNTYGNALLKIGRFSEAIKAFQKSKNLTTARYEHARSYHSTGITYLLQNSMTPGFEFIDKSIDLYSTLLNKNPPSLNYKIGQLANYAVTADLDNSSKIYHRLIAAKNIPKKIRGEVELYMSNICLLNNRPGEAKAHLEQAIFCEPKESLYYYHLALISDLYNPGETAHLLEHAIQLDEEDPTFNLEYLVLFPGEHRNYLAALAAEERKNMDHALALWKQMQADIDNRINQCDAYPERDRDKRKKEISSKYKKYYQVLKKSVISHHNKILHHIEN